MRALYIGPGRYRATTRTLLIPRQHQECQRLFRRINVRREQQTGHQSYKSVFTQPLSRMC